VTSRARTGPRVFAVLAAAVVTISTTLASASSADPTTTAGAPEPAGPVTVSLRNTCEFPLAGPQVITADLKAVLPESVITGETVPLTEVSVRFVLPEAMLKLLRDNAVASLEGVAGIGVDKASAMVTMPRTPLPAAGDLAVDLPAKVTPQLTAGKPGTMTFAVGALETLLMFRDSAGEPVGDVDVKKVTCTLEDGQETKLGTVSVRGKPLQRPSSGTATTPAPPPSAKAGKPTVPGKETRQGKPRVQDEPTQGCGPQPPDAFTFWTYYPLVGHATVRKLNSSVDFGPPGYMSAQLAFWFDPDTFAQCNGLVGDLLWPPARGRFTAFRFVPTEATVTITQTSPTVGVLDNGIFIGRAETSMSMADATVNGTPLPVGDKCGTSSPVVLDLRSKEGEWNPVADPAGFMEADFVIPPFTGCGTTQDLDPLFTGLVSGAGNHIRLDFGNVVFCSDVPPDFDGSKPCAPQLPAGRR
jgi:hypothetical protein